MIHTYSPDDYDAKGQLTLPLGFWAVLLLQARTWVLFAAAAASKQQSTSLLELFYPDSRVFWTGLGLGVPAALGLLLTGYRQRFPRLWRTWRGVLCLTLLTTLLVQGITLWLGEDDLSPLAIIFSGFDLLALCYLWLNQRLHDCFDPALNAG
ncbi:MULTISPECIES: DUF2919 domain-containing protein [unclassified Erwinia]|uniref:DUF2919 domain-containing protein n=1 Tax=unclassified Erwinia TaxID=2622719 RepID=UPI000832EF72|nr:DUF2919 domain-containing protein [Erwinia sp. ErVv1]